jgi:DNA processing protein
MTVDEIRLARAYLLRVAEPPAPEVVSLVRDMGAVRAAELVRAGKAADDETAARRHLDVAAMDIEAARAKHARLVIPEDEEWPAWQLLALANAAARGVPGMTEPLGLWVRGRARLDVLVQEAVAVIGARAATGYGEHVASEIGFGLAERSVTVVSGAAYGIDGWPIAEPWEPMVPRSPCWRAGSTSPTRPATPRCWPRSRIPARWSASTRRAPGRPDIASWCGIG